MSYIKKDNDISNDDRLYYNIAIANNETIDGYTYAFYKDNFNQQILNNPSDYYLSILRFSIPTADIPILIPEIQSWPNTNVDLTTYSITLNYTIGLNTYTSGETFVIFETVTPYSSPRPITATDPNPMKNPSNYYFIYVYTHFLRLVNTAFINAYNALNVATGGILTSVAPYFVYDSKTNLITLHADSAYLNSLANPIEIYMNYKLFTFFDALEFTFLDYLSNLGIRINIYDFNGTNHIDTEYLMEQQYKVLGLWNVFKSIRIVSNFIPTKNEIIPIPSYQNQNVLNTVPVIKDFIPFYQEGPEFRTFINYTHTGSYEIINLNSNSPLRFIDIAVYWQDRYGNSYLVSIPYNQVLTIKMCFIKKSTFTG